ncbi:MAG TPA: sugar phosphate nucleotidyltransferase [Candidatus Acidoferrum sp.]|jgi:mannose-1-phosphate guanylyltransferase
MPTEKLTTHAVILAGGRGTRFWPRSRTRTPKQLLNIVGEKTMLEQTVARLLPLIPVDCIWTVTNAEQAVAVRKQLPAAARKRLLTEPIGRNTAAAIALAAIHARHAAKGDALLAVLPADHYIAEPGRYRQIVAAALNTAKEKGRMVVLGIPPTGPETGFGYVEQIRQPSPSAKFSVYPVSRFAEKPTLAIAKQYVSAGNYLWNAGMFFWRVSTFLENLKTYLPKTHAALESLATLIGKSGYQRKLRAIYPKLENISVDYAILEPATKPVGAGLQPGNKLTPSNAGAAPNESTSQVFVIPAGVGWSDIGSWAAVYELLAKQSNANVLTGPGHTIDAHGNLLYSPKKFIAAIGIHDLVVVDTPDALLIVPRNRAQDVAHLVKYLEQQKLRSLL